jgi:hypothetical protein
MRRLLAIVLALVLQCQAARNFNGTSDIVTIPGNGTAVSFTSGSFTIAFWFYPTNVTNTEQSIISKWADGEQYLATISSPSGNAKTFLGAWHETSSPAHLFSNCGALVLSNNTWYHVVMTWNGTAANVEATVNGTSCGGLAIHGSTIQDTDALFFGAQTSSATFFQGRIADVGFWNVALSTGEGFGLDAGVSPLLVRRTALVAYYPVYGVTANEPDLSGGLLTGTLTGTTPANHCPCANPVLR